MASYKQYKDKLDALQMAIQIRADRIGESIRVHENEMNHLEERYGQNALTGYHHGYISAMKAEMEYLERWSK